MALLSAGQAGGRQDHLCSSDHHLEGSVAFVPSVCKTSGNSSLKRPQHPEPHRALASHHKRSLRDVLASRLRS